MRDSKSSEVAAKLRLSPATIQKYAREGLIPFDETPGGHRRFDIAEVQDVLQARRSTHESAHLANVVILTAIDDEYHAVCSHLPKRQRQRMPGGTIYETGPCEGDAIDWTVSVALIGAGNEGAAIEATKAIHALHPNLLLFVGVAGSLKPDDAPHGAVVVAERVYGYESGKDAEEFIPRPVSLQTCHGLAQLVGYVKRTNWHEGSEPIPVLVKPVAAGNKVVASVSSRTYQQIRKHYGDAIAVEMESYGFYLAAERSNRVPVVSVRGISDCVGDKNPMSDKEWQPIAAQNAAAFAFALLREVKPEDLARTITLEEVEHEAVRNLARVPIAVAIAIADRLESDDKSADRLLALLAAERFEPEQLVRRLFQATPRWLAESGDPMLWAGLGEFAAAHDLHGPASTAFKRADQIAGPYSAWWYRAAIRLAADGETSEAEAMVDQGEDVTGETAWSRLTRAVLAEDSAGVLEATKETEIDPLLLGVLRVAALGDTGRIPEAVNLADRLLESHLGATGLTLMLARMLMHAATDGSLSIASEDALLRARNLAFSARDLRRLWNGDTREAVQIAAQASLMLRDGTTALRVSTPAPQGEATEVEGSDPKVRTLRVHSYLLLHQVDDALMAASRIDDPIERRLLEADCKAEAGKSDEAAAAYHAAVELLGDPDTTDRVVTSQLGHALYGLAESGAHPLPQMETLRAFDPELATHIELVSDLARNELQAAVQRARSQPSSKHLPAIAEALARAGRTDDAVDVLHDAVKRLHRDDLLANAAQILARAGRHREAYDECARALAVVTPKTPVSEKLRRLSVQLAGELHDWEGVRIHANAARRDGDESLDARWALVGALYNLQEPSAALAEVQDAPTLTPRNTLEARLLIALHTALPGGLESVQTVLEVAERFSDSEEVGAAAVGAVLMRSSDAELPADMQRRLRATSDLFFVRFPESKILQKFEAKPETLSALLEATAPRADPKVESVVEQVKNGSLPLALLAGFSGKSYSELLTKRGAGWIVASSSLPEALNDERDAASAALGEAVVLETSAAHVAFLSGIDPTILLACFARVVVSIAGLEDAVLAKRSLGLRSTGFMFWDAASSKPTIQQVEPEVAEEWMSAASRVETIMRNCSLELPQEKSEQDRPLEVILHPIRMAKEAHCALYSDDVAVRLVAAAEGVSAFGTLGLLEAMGLEGHLPESAIAAALDRLRRARVVDLPWTEDDLLRIAEQESWLPNGGAAGALARPAFWADLETALAAFGVLVETVQQQDVDPQALQGWQASATHGFLSTIPAVKRPEASGTLLASAFMRTGLERECLRPLLRGARDAANTLGVGDVLLEFCRVLAAALTETFGEAQGGRLYVHMMQELSAQDRALALGRLFSSR